MPRFAANLTLLYTELPFPARIAAAARDGFAGVECQFPYAFDAAELAARAADAGLPWVLINTPAGDWAAGERGLAALPGREAEFRRGVDQALAYADALGCRRLHALAGRVPPGAERAALEATYVANLAWAARQVADAGCTLLVEALNPQDMPGYWLASQDEAHRVVQAVGAPNLKVQLDLYHCAMGGDDPAAELRARWPGGRIGHLQVAGVPGRHEPDAPHMPALFALIDALAGHAGEWVGAEYLPAGDTRAGLGWLRRLTPADH